MELDNLPGIFIPCKDLDCLRELVSLLYERDILTEESFKLINVPEDFDLNI